MASTHQLQSHINKVLAGGGEEAGKRNRKRNKLLPRERIDKLIDPGSFIDFSQLAGHELYGESLPSSGIITGIGPVHGHLCMFVANDPTVKRGLIIPNQCGNILERKRLLLYVNYHVYIFLIVEVYVVGSSAENGIHLLDCYPDLRSPCHVNYREDTVAHLLGGEQNIRNRFMPLSEGVTACIAHPLNGTIIAGTKLSSLLVVSQRKASSDQAEALSMN